MGSLYPAFEHLQPQSIRHNVPQIHQVFQDKQLLAQQSLCHTLLACVQECVLGEDKRRIPIVLLNGPVQSVKKSYIDAYLFVRVNEQPVSNLLQALLLKPSICDMPCNKSGRISEAEVQFEKVLGGWHINAALAELMKSDRGDEIENVTFSDLICGRHFRGSVIALTLMDKVGTKGLLMWSFSGMVVSTGIQVAAVGEFASTSIAEYLSVGGMLAFVFSFAVGAGPVPGLLLSEIFPNTIRAKAMAFCMSVHWVCNFLVGLLFLRLLEQMGPQLLYTMFGTF